MRAQLAVMLALAATIGILAACAPALGGDGFYRCARAGRCPTSAPYCHPADGLCHVAPASLDAGGTDADSTDAGWTDPYVDCTESCTATDEQCYSLTIDGIGSAGYCTPSCTLDAECPPYLGAPSACGPAGLCVRGCAGMGNCPAPFECISGRWSASGTLITACAGLELYAPFNEYDSCTTVDSCVRPLECIDGRCLRHCATTSPPCSDLEYCDTSPAHGAVCLFACDGDPSVCTSSFEAACDVRVCRPTSW